MFKSLLLKARALCLLTACILSSLAVTAQTKITGRIIGSDDRQPIVGAAVRISGTTVGTVTDVNGYFSLTGNPGQTLSVSYVGYITQQVAVTSGPINVTLQVSNRSLTEVVVTGYTSQLKKDISGSVATVNVSDAKQLATASSDQLLQGQAAGVTVVTQGTPGAGAQVYIRGISNFQNSQPLYVIDGVQTGSFKDISPNDIESISVLKDAGATAIYGVAGGNGVVVITTKKGKGKSTISYDGYYGTTKALGGNPLHLLNADQFLAYLKLADPTNAQINPATGQFYQYGYQGPNSKGFADAGNPAINPALYVFQPGNPSADYLIQKLNSTGAGTDWFHALYKSAPIQSHTLSASGSNDKNNYYTSFNYLNQQGTLLNSYYKRYSARVNTTFNIKDHVRFGENAQVDFTKRPGDFNNLDEGNAISFSYRQEPIVPIYDIAGNYGGTYDGLAQLGNSYNPVAIRAKVKNNYTKNWEAIASGFAEADVFKHFVVRTQYNVAFNNYYYFNLNSNPYDSGENHTTPTTVQEGAGYYSAYNYTNTINYAQIFGKHNIKFIAGYEVKGNQNRNISGQGNSPFSEDISYVNLTNTQLANRLLNSNTNFTTTTQSFFGRLDYQFNDKYILGATIRRDGTSVFAPGHQYGNFPSVSLAWRISQEDFMKGISWINDLKFRGSYGVAGFAGNVSGANAFTLFGSGAGTSYYPIDGSINSPTLGFNNTQLGNTNVTWERDKVGNGGFDATLFGNKLDITAEYYNKISSKLLFQLTLPATVGGATAPFTNIGSVKNDGFDISATYHLRPSRDLSFDIGANITTVRTKIQDLGGVGNFFTGGVRNGSVVYDQVGQPIGEFYGYKVIGYFSSAADVAASPKQSGAAPGAFKFQDTNGDGVIDQNDRTNIGNPNPKFNYGLNLNAKYKNFDLLAVFYGVQGNKVYNYTKYFTYFNVFPGNKNLDVLNNSWSPSNLNPAAPAPALPSSFSTDQQINSFYVENGSFLKLRTLQLGYSFAPAILKRIAVDRLRIYVQGANLFTATKYKGLDPEVQSVSTANGGQNSIGIDYGNYPNNERRYIAGASFTF